MKIGFFGTPGIASYVLEKLCCRFEVVFLVSPQDKRCGRDLKLQNCAAKDTAICHNVPVLQPGSLKDPEFAETLKAFGADIFVVVAYGKIIPASVFNIPPCGTINLHPSLLPKYRGAAPVQWALINGEPVTGVTVQMINEELDAGDIVLSREIAVDENMTAEGLYDIVLPMGAELVTRAVEMLCAGKTGAVRKQDHSQATYCGKIDSEMARIDWNKSAASIHNLVRGLNPKPAAWTTFREKHVKVWETRILREELPAPAAGELVVLHKKRLLAGTGDGILELVSMQPETKKRMDALAFINGYRLNPSERFE